MDLTGWLEYFSEGLAVQLREIKDLGKQAIKQSLLTKEHSLSLRQRLAIDYMSTGPDFFLDFLFLGMSQNYLIGGGGGN